MATEVKVRTGEVELRVTKLTKSILKQIEEVDWQVVKDFLDGKGHFKDWVVVGWVHGSVFDKDEDYKRWLILKVGEGDYKRYDVMHSTIKEKCYPQLYVI